jgi:tRNA threonylcarbamoyladenosine biosynthesis protein TsaB
MAIHVKVVAFDLSTRQGSIALVSTAEDSSCEALEKREWPNDRRSSAPFFSALDDIVRRNGPPDLIVVGLGPGSYTGTRIAISAGLGLKMACGSKLCGLPSICAMSSETDFVVIGDAKRATFFFGRITQHQIAGEIELLSEIEMRARIGETAVPIYTADDLPQFGLAQRRFPRAEQLCFLAQRGENVAHPPLEPIYLRPPHITSPTNA